VARLYVPDLIRKPLPDTDPDVTAKVVALVNSVSDKRADPAILADNLINYLKGDVMAGWSKRISDPGPVKKVELIDKVRHGDTRLFLYRLTCRDDILDLRVNVGPDGKITDFGIEPE